MKALQEALKRKMGEKKPDVAIGIGLGEPKPDQEMADGQIEGDAIEKKRLQEENDLAPELEGEEMALERQEASTLEDLKAHEGEETDLLQQILAALADRSPMAGRGAMGLGERVGENAKQKLATLKK